MVLKTRKRIEIATQAVFNDGLWHKVRNTDVTHRPLELHMGHFNVK